MLKMPQLFLLYLTRRRETRFEGFHWIFSNNRRLFISPGFSRETSNWKTLSDLSGQVGLIVLHKNDLESEKSGEIKPPFIRTLIFHMNLIRFLAFAPKWCSMSLAWMLAAPSIKCLIKSVSVHNNFLCSSHKLWPVNRKKAELSMLSGA